MFRRLRLRLTLLYLLAAVLLTAAIDGGVYALLRYSFQSTTDEALRRKIELSVESLGPTASGGGIQSSEEGDDESSAPNAPEEGDRYDAELAPVFVVPLDAQAHPLAAAVGAAVPLSPDEDAIRAAAATGANLRTVVQADGTRYRLLTTRVATSSGVVYLQARRSL